MAVALLVVALTAIEAKPLVRYQLGLLKCRCVNTRFATRNAKE
jgi:hypothetical protein